MSAYFGTGIKLSTGFDISAQGPADNRTVVDTLATLNAMPNVQRYNGLLVYVEAEKTYYSLIDNVWKPAFGIGGGGGTVEVPTKVSELENDAGYITRSEVPNDTVISETQPTGSEINMYFEPVSVSATSSGSMIITTDLDQNEEINLLKEQVRLMQIEIENLKSVR